MVHKDSLHSIGSRYVLYRSRKSRTTIREIHHSLAHKDKLDDIPLQGRYRWRIVEGSISADNHLRGIIQLFEETGMNELTWCVV
jgi:hypothetical protein